MSWKVLPLRIANVLFNLSLVVATPLLAQTVEPDVTNSAGFSSNMDGMSLSNSIGESATSTITGSNSIITQGFLQPELFSPCNGIEFRVYPNPFLDVITIDIQNCDQPLHSVVVYDLYGKELVRKVLAGNQIHLGILPVGMYVVLGLSEQGAQLGSFKINRTKSP